MSGHKAVTFGPGTSVNQVKGGVHVHGSVGKVVHGLVVQQVTHDDGGRVVDLVREGEEEDNFDFDKNT